MFYQYHPNYRQIARLIAYMPKRLIDWLASQMAWFVALSILFERTTSYWQIWVDILPTLVITFWRIMQFDLRISNTFNMWKIRTYTHTNPTFRKSQRRKEVLRVTTSAAISNRNFNLNGIKIAETEEIAMAAFPRRILRPRAIATVSHICDRLPQNCWTNGELHSKKRSGFYCDSEWYLAIARHPLLLEKSASIRHLVTCKFIKRLVEMSTSSKVMITHELSESTIIVAKVDIDKFLYANGVQLLLYSLFTVYRLYRNYIEVGRTMQRESREQLAEIELEPLLLTVVTFNCRLFSPAFHRLPDATCPNISAGTYHFTCTYVFITKLQARE